MFPSRVAGKNLAQAIVMRRPGLRHARHRDKPHASGFVLNCARGVLGRTRHHAVPDL